MGFPRSARPGAASAMLIASSLLFPETGPGVSAAETGQNEPRCLFVSSYHPGNHWSDGIEAGLRRTLEDQCLLRVFYLDSKRNRDPGTIARAAERARDLIDEWEPDVVVTADDHAARYLVVPWLRDVDIPVVFCGVNWTVEEYGFPFTNVTGMVEVAPVGPLLDLVRQVLPQARTALYLGADTVSESKNLERTREIAEERGFDLGHALVSGTGGWIEAYRRAQQHDFVILGNHAGIDGWDPDAVRRVLLRDTRRLSVTTYRAMTPYAMLGYTKVPEEQGEWAGKLAVEILGGAAPGDFPIVANRQWDIWINTRLLTAGHIHLPFRIMHRAKWVSRVGD